MPIYSVNGSILETKAQVIAHGVAAWDIEDMKTGLAKKINQAWPDSFSRFKKIRRSNSFKPGEVIIDEKNNPLIAYLATQANLYHAALKYVNQSLRALRKELEDKGIKSCAIPKIGCGYGKLPWNRVRPVIERRLKDSDIDFLLYDHYRLTTSTSLRTR